PGSARAGRTLPPLGDASRSLGAAGGLAGSGRRPSRRGDGRARPGGRAARRPRLPRLRARLVGRIRHRRLYLRRARRLGAVSARRYPRPRPRLWLERARGPRPEPGPASALYRDGAGMTGFLAGLIERATLSAPILERRQRSLFEPAGEGGPPARRLAVEPLEEQVETTAAYPREAAAPSPPAPPPASPRHRDAPQPPVLPVARRVETPLRPPEPAPMPRPAESQPAPMPNRATLAPPAETIAAEPGPRPRPRPAALEAEPPLPRLERRTAAVEPVRATPPRHPPPLAIDPQPGPLPQPRPAPPPAPVVASQAVPE